MLAHDYVFDNIPFRSGADGVIVRALNVKGEECAIKIFKLNTPEITKRFRNEIKLAKQLSIFPGIVSIIEAFQQSKTGYLVMDLADHDLLDLLEQETSFNERDALLIFQELCEAVQILHEQEIAHLDIKPENILLHKGKLQLCDFANSQRVDKPQTTSSNFTSTPAYTAPERFDSATFDLKAADIWSLGILLHVLITGCYPFLPSASSPPQYPRTLEFSFVSARVSPTCLDLIQSLLSLDPSNRPPIHDVLKHPAFKIISECTLPNNM